MFLNVPWKCISCFWTHYDLFHTPSMASGESVLKYLSVEEIKSVVIVLFPMGALYLVHINNLISCCGSIPEVLNHISKGEKEEQSKDTPNALAPNWQSPAYRVWKQNNSTVDWPEHQVCKRQPPRFLGKELVSADRQKPLSSCRARKATKLGTAAG